MLAYDDVYRRCITLWVKLSQNFWIEFFKSYSSTNDRTAGLIHITVCMYMPLDMARNELHPHTREWHFPPAHTHDTTRTNCCACIWRLVDLSAITKPGMQKARECPDVRIEILCKVNGSGEGRQKHKEGKIHWIPQNSKTVENRAKLWEGMNAGNYL